MRLIKNGDTSHLIHVLMVDSTDHVTAKTGLTLTVTRSKNGAAFAAWGGSVAEVANGIYKLTPASGDVDTQGELCIHATGTAADPSDVIALVIAFDPHAVAGLGLTNLDVASSTLATAANLATVAGYVDTEVAAILAAVDTEVAAIKAKTDNLPASPAAVGSAMTLDGTQTVTTTNVNVAQLFGLLNLLKSMANGKFDNVSGVLTMKAADDTTTIGVSRTVTGTVPANFSRS